MNDTSARCQVAAGAISVFAFAASVFVPWSTPLYVAGAAGLLAMAVQVAWSVSMGRRNRQPAVDRRGLQRLGLAFSATLDWTGSAGNAVSVEVRGIDLSRMGAMVRSPEALPPGSVVFVNIRSHGLMGVAHVRHCTPWGRGFRIGLEFRSPLMRREAGEWQISYRAAG